MSRIATDIVLLPDQALTACAIELNRRLRGNHRSEIVLSTENCLPHVSLAMGCLEEQDIGAVQELLQRLAEETGVRQLKIVGVLHSTNARGETTTVLEVERSCELQALHEQVMRRMEPLFSHDVTDEMVYGEVVAPSTLEYIRNYPKRAAFDRFVPHITIGYGGLEHDPVLPPAFRVTRLALCHLGNHCTCRRVLAHGELEA